MMEIQGSYNYGLVALSVALAMFSAYAALDLADRVTVTRGGARALWLGGGATAIGLGIWAMNYIGMLALRLPVPVLYHYPTVLLSLLAAIATSVASLFMVSRERMGLARGIAGSFVVGGGIAATHYIGVAAMRLRAVLDYRWDRVAFSLILAVGISLAAQILVFIFRARPEKRISVRNLVNAVVIGSAIPLVHCTGMWAVIFRPSNLAPDLTHTVSVSLMGVASISANGFLVLFAAILTSFLDRLVGEQKGVMDAARESELYFQTLAEAVPEIIWNTRADGVADFYNKRWYDYTGLNWEQSRDSGWHHLVHPDDLPVVLTKWQHSLRSGETYELELRMRRSSDGSYRWHLVRAIPARGPDHEIVKWFGTCTDIEDQKQNQQILEEQIKERTLELADTNTRLQEEILERDLARRELGLQNDRMMHELTERSLRATLLTKMGEVLQSCLTKDEVFAAALGFAPKVFLVRGAIALLNAERSVAEVIGSWADCNLPDAFEPNACWALRTGHPHLVVAGDTTAPCAHAVGVLQTYLCVPILAQGEALGILHFQATEESPSLGDSELSLKTTFAGQVGLSIANIRLRDALRTQSIRDPLTGLYNRRYLEEAMEREIRRAARAEQSLGIVILDLDHFKKFNDTYGHDAGDIVLSETASQLTKSVRAEDTVCRFGGEEFVIVLPTANVDAAHMRAERIRSQIRGMTILHQGKSLGMITVSSGVSAFPANGTSARELLEAADAALYRAKREGRDRVVAAGPRPTVRSGVARAE
jgi:diguanylate cyclase (GGDEF)-like protein/PAS domain S-box-containing protein